METYGYLILGVILPPVVSLLKRARWATKVKYLVSIAIAFVATGVAMAIDGNLAWGDTETLLQNAAIVWSASQVVYTMYFGSTNVNTILEHSLVK